MVISFAVTKTPPIITDALGGGGRWAEGERRQEREEADRECRLIDQREAVLSKVPESDTWLLSVYILTQNNYKWSTFMSFFFFFRSGKKNTSFVVRRSTSTKKPFWIYLKVTSHKDDVKKLPLPPDAKVKRNKTKAGWEGCHERKKSKGKIPKVLNGEASLWHWTFSGLGLHRGHPFARNAAQRHHTPSARPLLHLSNELIRRKNMKCPAGSISPGAYGNDWWGTTLTCRSSSSHTSGNMQ